MVLARTGYGGTGSAAARSFARYGRAASGPAPGVIAVWPHHVGFVVGAVAPGRIRVISGNHNHRVAESTYSTRSVMAFRYPDRGKRVEPSRTALTRAGRGMPPHPAQTMLAVGSAVLSMSMRRSGCLRRP
jgi:hypothetical protein